MNPHQQLIISSLESAIEKQETLSLKSPASETAAPTPRPEASDALAVSANVGEEPSSASAKRYAAVLMGNQSWKGANSSLQVISVWLSAAECREEMRRIQKENAAWHAWLGSPAGTPMPPCRHYDRLWIVLAPLY